MVQPKGRGNRLIAVDAGGSKTEFCVRPLQGGEERYYTFGGANYKTASQAQATQNLVQAFGQVCKAEGMAPEDVRGIVFGIAGCDTPEDFDRYSGMVAQIGLPQDRIKLYNDCELAFLAVADPPGICVVAGTGSNAMAFHPQKPALRAGGWGALLSDEGSGYWIASVVLRRMLLYCDGAAPKQAVYNEIAKFYGVKLEQAPYLFTGMNGARIAASARVIMDFAAGGDAYCRQVVAQAVNGQARLVKALYHRMGFEADTPLQAVFIGSLFRDKAYLEGMEKALGRLHPGGIEYRHITSNTSESAMQMAQKLFAPHGVP